MRSYRTRNRSIRWRKRALLSLSCKSNRHDRGSLRCARTPRIDLTCPSLSRCSARAQEQDRVLPPSQFIRGTATMTHLENDLIRTLIPTHQPHYWRSRRLAFTSIRALERALQGTKNAALYVCSGCNEDGEPLNITENIAPFDELVAAQQEVMANPNAHSILTAQKRLHLLEQPGF